MGTLIESQADIKKQLPALMSELRSAKGVLIGTHLHPDGDAIGAALAFSHILEQLEIEHEVLCNDPPPYYLKFLPGSSRIRNAPREDGRSLALILDLEALGRLGSVRPYFEACSRAVVIDHHIPHESPGDLRIVCPSAPATCSIILDLFRDSEVVITPQIADCLLAGILTDTGNFRYPNTDARCLHAAGYLLEMGADLTHLTKEVYMSRERQGVEMTAYAVMNMKMACEGKVAWATLPLSLFEQLNANEQHSEGIANDLLSIKNVAIAAVLRESSPGKIRGSLRSVGALDVAAVAREFGGGGHHNAAGVSLSCSLEEAEHAVSQALIKCLDSSS